MKAKPQTMTTDGFDRSVAEKMPRMKKLEEPLLPDQEEEVQPFAKEYSEVVQEQRAPETQAEKRVIFEPPKTKTAAEPEHDLGVLRLIEDLHTQLLASSRAKKALEMDLVANQKTIHQMAQDNKELRNQVEGLSKEIRKFEEGHSESVYLKEENEEALDKIQELQQELKEMKQTMTGMAMERDEALNRGQELESQLDQNELVRIKGKMKEREASHFSEENQALQARLEEALATNMEIQKKYDVLKRSFNEVKESLTLLRDSYKKNYYNLSESPDGSSLQ